jgi:PAS domain S-box-containing protein
LAILGYESDEYVGRNIAAFHVDRDVIDDMLARLARGDAIHDCPARMRAQDGSIRDVRVNANACFEDGRFLYSRGFTRDVSERLRAEQGRLALEERFSRFMHHLPGLAWIKDLQGRYAYVNDAAEKAFVALRSKLIGATDADLFPAATAEQFQANDRAALESPAGVLVVETLTHEDGTLHHSLVSKFSIPDLDGKPAWIGGMAIDITERIDAENALREAARRKDEFIATLAHELRNPLAPIRNALEIMRIQNADGKSNT